MFKRKVWKGFFFLEEKKIGISSASPGCDSVYIYTGDAGVVFSYVCTQVYSGLSRQTNLLPFPHPLSIPSMIFNRRTEKASSHEEFKVACLPNRQTNAKGVHR